MTSRPVEKPIYLLDVSVLIAFGMSSHTLHRRVTLWLQGGQFASLLTCSITELGFVRILSQTLQYEHDVNQAILLLSELKRSYGLPFAFIADDSDLSSLPAWVRRGRQTTDGHLLQLATAHDAQLATLDQGIPGAFVIP